MARTVGGTLVAAAVLVASVLVAPSPAAGATPQPVTVRMIGGAVTTYTDCDGVRNVTADSLLISIQRVGAETSGDLHVDLAYGGSLVAGVDYQPLPASVTIPAGETTSILAANRITTTPGTLVVEATGPGISPATGQATTSQTSFACTTYPPVTRRVVVGQPLRLELIDDLFPDLPGFILDSEIDVRSGTVPPGLSAGATITGTPTSVGRYSFVMQACVGPVCAARFPLTIDVVAPDAPPSTSPPSSDPAVAGPTAAPPAATPVAAVPAFTG